MSSENVIVGDLEAAIAEYQAHGWRLDMIFPADNPREAIMSRERARVNLKADNRPVKETSAPFRNTEEDPKWIAGRAGMEYRDLIPDRVGGKVIASNIRLLADGPVADYVHYHKIEFQMIYCLKGWIEVVYEDQGPPFWLEAGDCVVQPPEIRHRVLFAEGGAEVLEVTMPAEHETWADHEMTLPNESIDKERRFNGQSFVLTKRP